MGKRYGRNQKRQHRARIAALEEMREMDRAILRRTFADLAALKSEVEEWDEEIRRLLGEYSAFRRDTPEFRSNHPIREMPIIEPAPSAWEPDAVLTIPVPTRERMRRFIFTINKDDMRMQRLIRFMETDGMGGVAYSISETALMQGFGKREIAYMAHKIAANLAEHWNSQQGARNRA